MPSLPLQNPSQIVVSTRESLRQNFSENSLKTFCQLSASAGALGVGAEILGLVSLPPPLALATVGAVAAAAVVCPAAFSNDKIFGKPPPFSGGQCQTAYRVSYIQQIYTDARCSIGGGSETNLGILAGPIGVVDNQRYGCLGSRDESSQLIITSSNAAPIVLSSPWGAVSGSLQIVVSRRDGQPDNCGDAPNSGGQIIINNITGDTINNSTVVDNRKTTLIAPVTINAGGINGTINMSFGDIKIGSLFPLNFDIDIGGVRFGFGEKPDGTFEPRQVNPDPGSPATEDESVRAILQRLDRIIGCVCGPEVDIQNLFLPTVSGYPDCAESVEILSIQAGSFSAAQMERFIETAALAQNFCDTRPPKQEPEVLIFAASTTTEGSELFTPSFGPNVVSLRLKITDVRQDGPSIITLYPGAQQRKFGSVSFVLDSVSGGGDYIYLFDTENYVPLPKRGKTGRLRILMKRGLSLEVYDTGERL